MFGAVLVKWYLKVKMEQIMDNLAEKICILDYGSGNTGSIKNMLKKIGCLNVVVSSTSSDVLSATHLILPGVGRFDKAMEALKNLSLIEVVYDFVKLQRPLLGICLGMQLLGNSSEEGNSKGLGIIDFHVKKFDSSMSRKIPHMGMNNAIFYEVDGVMRTSADSRFYFVHSYHATNVNSDSVLARTVYNGYEFVSAVRKENVIGVQFHPEKSHKYGMLFLKSFIDQSI